MTDTSAYQTPEIERLNKESASAQQSYVDYQSASAMLPQKLRQAIQEKLDYNKDLIEKTNKDFAEYAKAPAEARAKYADPTSPNYIFNPFQAEQLVSQTQAQAYEPYATGSDLLAERRGTISDLVSAGTAAFSASALAAQGKAELARGNFDRALEIAKLVEAERIRKQTESKNPEAVRAGVKADATSGAGLDELMKKYSDKLDPDEVLRLYDTNTPYGPHTESNEELHTKYKVTLDKKSDLTPGQKLELRNSLATDISGDQNAGIDREQSKRENIALYPELDEEEFNKLYDALWPPKAEEKKGETSPLLKKFFEELIKTRVYG